MSDTQSFHEPLFIIPETALNAFLWRSPVSQRFV
jgi:hypothetical protein